MEVLQTSVARLLTRPIARYGGLVCPPNGSEDDETRRIGTLEFPATRKNRVLFKLINASGGLDRPPSSIHRFSRDSVISRCRSGDSFGDGLVGRPALEGRESPAPPPGDGRPRRRAARRHHEGPPP